MRIDIATLFPEMCDNALAESIIGRARRRGDIELYCHQIRDYTLNRQKQVDDYPYGGGHGMIMQAQPVYDCCRHIIEQVQAAGRARPRVIFLTAAGTPLTEAKCKELAACESLLLVCGHYEGMDERVIEALADEELSIGDYVLTGGEIPAVVIADAVVRLIPGAIGDEQSALSDSFQDNLLAPPVYTRPAEYNGWRVPDVLLSGHKARIDDWKHEQALARTRLLRPDLLDE